MLARELGVHRATVGTWRTRFAAKRLDGLREEPRVGAPRSITDAQVERVIATTRESAPAHATHWSSRALARRLGMSQTAVSRIGRAFALQPHRAEAFTLSTAPQFVETVRDIVGLVRHGTRDLFAALDVRAGTVIGELHRRHRAVEFRMFLDTVDRHTPPELAVHLILDNSAIHKTPIVHRWLAKRPRFSLHFTPTSASWLNLVECWFSLLTARQLRRGSFRSTYALEQAIKGYIAATNAEPKPFVWTKTADEILAAVARFCQRTSNSGH